MLAWLVPIAQAEPVELPLTLVDLPYNAALRAPSMAQSLELTFATERLAVHGLHAAFEHIQRPALRYGLGFAALGAVNGAMALGPLAWMHEEWHRAVLGRHDLSSRNAIWFPADWHDGLIPVDHVADADLAWLKENHPADSARLMEAGVEAQHALSRALGDAVFLADAPGRLRGPVYRSQSWMAMSMQVAELGALLYDVQCASPRTDATTDATNRITPTESSRDAIGLDCTAWIYEQRRPDTPYVARGPHPYGEGIDRYISHEDLSEAEREALRRQVPLHLLNFLNPQMLGIDGFVLPSGGRDRWMLSLGQVPTPFGWTLETHLLLRHGSLAAIGELQLHVAGERVGPGLSVRVVDHPLVGPLSLGVGGGLWLQPRDLRWDATALQPGGRMDLTLRVRGGHGVDAFVLLQGKTAGWVLGDPYTDAQLGARAGLVVRLP